MRFARKAHEFALGSNREPAESALGHGEYLWSLFDLGIIRFSADQYCSSF